MRIPFFKYHGAGNDFILIDQRRQQFLSESDRALIYKMCFPHFGVGADGLILLQEKPGYDFEMVYFNSDGRLSSFCGNGSRCIVAFAKFLGIIENHCHFLATDGEHVAKIVGDDWVEMKMKDVGQVEAGEDYFILDTGSPHYVIFVEDLSDLNVVENGQAIRYSDRFRQAGINVNFVEEKPGGIAVATYERGVENETLSCGTGVTAAAISYFLKNGKASGGEVAISTKGGDLKVRFQPDGAGGFREVWLCGGAVQVFQGVLNHGDF